MPKEPFLHELVVAPGDFDELGHVNNVVYIRWVQEVAQAHWLTVASSEIRQRYLWVVLRHEIDYRRPVYPKESVAGSTWVGNYHGARFERFVKIHSPGGTTVFAEARTMWCLLDATSMKPLRIPDEVLELL